MSIKKLQAQFIFRIAILSTLILSFNLIGQLLQWPFISNVVPFIVLLFASVSTICHIFLLKTSAKSFHKFTNAFLLTTTIKLLMYLSLMAIFAFLNKTEAKVFILNFAAIYFLYTPFEVLMILKQARVIDRDKNQQK